MEISVKKALIAISACMLAAGAVIADDNRLLKPASVSAAGGKNEYSDISLKRETADVRRITESDLEGRNLTLILAEDFSKMTEGTEDAPASWTVNDQNSICDDEFFNTPGWSGQGVFSAGGAVGLTYPGVGGTLNTPLGVYAGKLVVKFRARAFNGDTWLFLNICKGGIMYPTQAHEGGSETIELHDADGWQDYVIEITSLQPDDDSFVQFNGVCYRNGCLLDDIEIYRDNDFIWTPQYPVAGDFQADGFTAGWSEVIGADSYLVSLYEEKINGTENVVGNVDFNTIDTTAGVLADEDVPEGWDIHLASETQVTADGGSDGSPALVLGDEDYVQLPVNGGTYLSFSFFAKPVSKGENSGYLYIEVLDPASGKWNTWGYMSVDAFPAEGKRIAMSDFEEQYAGSYRFKGLYTGVRLRVKSSTSPAIVDDIMFETTPPSERRALLEDMVTDGTSYEFTGLDPEAEHYFTVKSRKGNMMSAPTPFTHAFGISRPVVKEASDIDRRGGFTANWDYTPKADRYKVDVYSVDVVESDRPDAVLLHEDFSNVHSEVGTPASPEEIGNYYDVVPLDDYVGVPGWEGRGNIIVDGMIGCMQDETGSFELYSPYMSLQNNDGNYKVRMKVASMPGEKFVVQGTGVYAMYDVEQEGISDICVELTEGSYRGRLMFYTLNGMPFLIDELCVTQDLKKGDHLYTKLTDAEETGTGHRFSVDNSSVEMFAYNLLAEHDVFGMTCRSEMSDMAFVTFNVGVSDIDSDDSVAIVRSLPGMIEVTLDEAAAIEVFDITGRKISVVDGSRGDNLLASASGIYIVRVAGRSVKVMVNE